MTKYKILATVVILAGLGLFLSRVFSGTVILPQIFHLGPIAIHYYGLILALAAASGFYLAVRRAPQFGINQKQAEDILFWVIIGGFIGARLYHVLSSAPYYWQNPLDIFKVWNGGLSIYGAVLGGIVTMWTLAQIFNLPASAEAMADKQSSIFNLLDWLTPSVLIGQIIGRFGNLFNYEVFGYPTNLPWKMFVPLNFRPLAYQNFNFFHPWFLYEALGNLIILFFLLKIAEPKVKNRLPGFLVFLYLLLYNSLRFALEFLRIGSTFIGRVRLNAAVSLLLVAVSLAGLFYVRKHPKVS